MADSKEYYTQKAENGSIQISEDVVASVAAMAVLEQEGVCGLSAGLGSDIAEMLGVKSVARAFALQVTRKAAFSLTATWLQTSDTLCSSLQRRCRRP